MNNSETANIAYNETFMFPEYVAITFDTNGGTVFADDTLFVVSGEKTKDLPTADRDGYTFTGWYTEATDGIQVTDETIFTEDATLYAHWESMDPCGNGHTWDSGVITKEPTETEEGVMTFTCTVCGETRTELIPVLEPTENPFTDVAKGKFYYDPVLWAISQDPQITTGVTDTTFMPDRICTRAHVVTFLWRANGCPEPTNTTNTFKDVPNGKYYTKAVLWAAEQGITTGYSDGTFRPDDECTRGQVVTFLWRAKGQPIPASMSNPFTDVPNGKYYTNAVLWALENGITQGRTSTTFGPEDSCTRGHVVTFLYRAYN